MDSAFPVHEFMALYCLPEVVDHGASCAGMSGPPPPPPPAAAAITPINAVTAMAQKHLRMYCRVVVGDAKFRSRLFEGVMDRVFLWMSQNRGKLMLFGRRAWNAHLRDKAFVEQTVDVDIFVSDCSEFSAFSAQLLKLLHEDVPACIPFMNPYNKPHMDNRGRTLTIEVCGVVLIDLSTRDMKGSFCIGEMDSLDIDPPCVERQVVPGGCRVSLLRRKVMLEMLTAEAKNTHWRRERAERDLQKYLIYDALGFFEPDEDSVSPTAEGAAPAVVQHETLARHEAPARTVIDVSFQIPILAKYIRHCVTHEECLRVATNLFFWVEGDAMHTWILRLLKTRTLGECRLLGAQMDLARNGGGGGGGEANDVQGAAR